MVEPPPPPPHQHHHHSRYSVGRCWAPPVLRLRPPALLVYASEKFMERMKKHFSVETIINHWYRWYNYRNGLKRCAFSIFGSWFSTFFLFVGFLPHHFSLPLLVVRIQKINRKKAVMNTFLTIWMNSFEFFFIAREFRPILNFNYVLISELDCLAN